MTSFLVGLIITGAIIAFAEIFRKIDLSFFASMNLVAIPFIYIGFSIHPDDLMLTIPAAMLFVLFAYLGYKMNYKLTVIGLALHGLWDVLFPRLSTAAPDGYDVFCITIDILLAVYFYFKLKPTKNRSVALDGKDNTLSETSKYEISTKL